jgi:hypothetical protein
LTSSKLWTTSRTWGMMLVLIGLVQLGIPGSALAQDKRAMVIFPLESSLTSKEDAHIPRKLVEILIRESKNRGMKVTTAQATFTETAFLMGCDPELSSCPQTILEQIGADHAILGRVEPSENAGRVRVSLVHIGRHVPPVRRTFEIETEQAEEQLTAALPPLFGGESADGQENLIVTPTPTPTLTPTPGESGGSGLAFDRIKHSSWGLLGGGTAVMVTGIVLWGLASSDQSRINDSPLLTLQDFERVRSLERSASRKATFGNLCFVTGLATATLGAVLAYKQARIPAIAETNVIVAPMPLNGGMGITLTLGWPQ